MSTIKSSDEHLTLNADGSSKDIKFQANGVEKASISSSGAFTSTTIDATKLTGNLPAISGASLTSLPADSTKLPLAGGTMTGAIVGVAGSASAPSYSFSGDTNTGIFKAATDTIGFTAGGTTGMQLGASGYVGIGTGVPTTSRVSMDVAHALGHHALVLNNHSYYTPNGLRMINGDTVNRGGNEIAFQRGSSVVGSISTSTSGTTYNTSSDYRLKENVDYTWDATTRLKQLKPARFNFIADDTNTLVDGFIAHEVSSVVPEAVSGIKDAMLAETFYTEDDVETQGDNPTKLVGDVKTYSSSKINAQGIDQSKLVPLLVKTIQELEARITALEA